MKDPEIKSIFSVNMFLNFFSRPEWRIIFSWLNYVMAVNVVTCMKTGDLIYLAIEEIGFDA